MVLGDRALFEYTPLYPIYLSFLLKMYVGVFVFECCVYVNFRLIRVCLFDVLETIGIPVAYG